VIGTPVASLQSALRITAYLLMLQLQPNIVRSLTTLMHIPAAMKKCSDGR
jgi:hypothetical protein